MFEATPCNGQKWVSFMFNDERHILHRGLRYTDIPQVGRYTRPQLLQISQTVASVTHSSTVET